MSDEIALLDAVASHPEEDTPRLIYADWLDEHADDTPDPELTRIRAEFIRVQIEKIQCSLQVAEYAQYERLCTRESEIQRDAPHAILGPAVAIQKEYQLRFDRGFPCFKLMAYEFIKHGHLFEQVRTPELAVSNSGDYWQELFSHPQFPLVTHLSLYSYIARYGEWSLEPSAVERLGELVGRNRLRSLNFSNCGVNDAGVRSLVRHAGVWQLTDLNLHGNGVHNEGLLTLLDSSIASALRNLDLSENPITSLGAFQLADRWPEGVIRHLKVTDTKIGKSGRQALIARFGSRVEL